MAVTFDDEALMVASRIRARLASPTVARACCRPCQRTLSRKSSVSSRSMPTTWPRSTTMRPTG